MAVGAPQPKKRSRGRLACGGCLGLLAAGLGMILCIGGFLVLRTLGIFGPDAHQLYSGAPDLVASAAVEQALFDAGLENAQAMVIPIAGSDGQIAVITIDQTSSSGRADSPAQAFDQAVQGLAQTNAGGDHRIERVTLDLRDENGEPGIAVTAPHDQIEAYAKGEISRRELMGQADVDLSELIDPATVDQLLEEAGQ